MGFQKLSGAKKQGFDQFSEKVIFYWFLAIFQLWAPKNGQKWKN
jgi:hypothetical protein